MNILIWVLFVIASLLEVGGDALIRHGLRCSKSGFILGGFATLGCYGLMVNMVKWDFSRLLGVYIGFFALVSVLVGWLVFRENIPMSTWLGLGLIMAGCMVVQFGQR